MKKKVSAGSFHIKYHHMYQLSSLAVYPHCYRQGDKCLIQYGD